MDTPQNSSIRANPNGDLPEIDPTAYIDPSAQMIGRVRIGADVFVGPNAVLRADELADSGTMASIEIGPESNVQDGVVMHALAGTLLSVGARTSVSHGCILHGPAVIGGGCFIGFRSVVFDATLGQGAFLGAGSVVQGVELPPDTLAPPGSTITSAAQASDLPTTGPEEKTFQQNVIAANLTLAQGYRRHTAE